MKKETKIYTIIFFICSLYFSCREETGQFKNEKYYDSGNLKKVIFYNTQNESTDSIYIYYDSADQLIKYKLYKKEIGTYENLYYENGNLFRKGLINNSGNKEGNWYYYRSDGKLSDIREYMSINGKTQLNQIRFFNKEGNSVDIGFDDFNIYDQEKFKAYEIKNKHSNYTAFTIPEDTISLNEPFIVIAHYLTPLYKKENSEIEIYIDENENLENDFSSEKDINYRMFISLARDTINQKAFPNAKEFYNHMSSFGTYYETSGKKILKGYLMEVVKDTMENEQVKKEFKNKIFFKFPLYVKDTDK